MHTAQNLRAQRVIKLCRLDLRAQGNELNLQFHTFQDTRSVTVGPDLRTVEADFPLK